MVIAKLDGLRQIYSNCWIATNKLLTTASCAGHLRTLSSRVSTEERRRAIIAPLRRQHCLRNNKRSHLELEMSKCGFCNKCSSVQYYCHCCPSSSELCTSQRSIDQIVNLYYRQAVAIDREVLSCLRSRLLWKFDWNGSRGARRQFRETANFRYGPSRAEHNISIEGEFRFTNEGEEIRSRARTYRMHLNWNSGQHAVHCTALLRLVSKHLCCAERRYRA